MDCSDCLEGVGPARVPGVRCLGEGSTRHVQGIRCLCTQWSPGPFSSDIPRFWQLRNLKPAKEGASG